MKIVYFGTPDFAVPSLNKLFENGFEISAVVTAPDKERGRGRKVSSTPVKLFAVENGIKILQPEKMKNENFIDELKSLNADLFVIVAFRILPKEVYTIPKFGSFNLHGSLLPKYRGAAPIQWAIINGEKETGLTTFFLQDKVDTGNMIFQEKLPILEDDNLGTMHDKMAELGAGLVLKTVKAIEAGNVSAEKQNDELACPAPKITKETCLINWNNTSGEIQNLIRGLSPYPCAFFEKEGRSYKIFKSFISDQKLNPGEVLQTKHQIFIGSKSEAIEILELQPEGRKRMTADEFCRGYNLNS